MRSIHSVSHKLFVLFAILSSKKPAGCNPITNSNLNDHIREFSLKDDNTNSTRIKTLQKQEPGRYANFAPVRNPVRFKESEQSDSALSSSSNSRGLLHHEHPEHPGYILHEYEESPHIGYGYEYHLEDSDHGHHGFHHHVPDHYHGHHGGHRYHHKHYDHALAAKTILWPIAGIALLGAAAALVSNPILLQLGVVSGRRKRRDTEEISEPELNGELSWLKKENEMQIQRNPKIERNKYQGIEQSHDMNFSYKETVDNLKNRVPKKLHSNLKQEALFKKVHPTVQSPIEEVAVHTNRYAGNKKIYDNKFVPVPLIIKDRKFKYV